MLDRLLEPFGSLLLLVATLGQIQLVAHLLTRGELPEDAHGFAATNVPVASHSVERKYQPAWTCG